MYSYEKRIRAVELYIKYDRHYRAVFRELGYPPSANTIKKWYNEYVHNGDLHKFYIDTRKHGIKYSEEQRKTAVQYYVERNKYRTVKALGYPSRAQLINWIRQDLPEEENNEVNSQYIQCMKKAKMLK